MSETLQCDSTVERQTTEHQILSEIYDKAYKFGYLAGKRDGIKMAAEMIELVTGEVECTSP